MVGFERFLTADEAAEELRKLGVDVSPKTLAEHGRTAKLPSRKVNGRRRFRLSELMAHYDGRSAAAAE